VLLEEMDSLVYYVEILTMIINSQNLLFFP